MHLLRPFENRWQRVEAFNIDFCHIEKPLAPLLNFDAHRQPEKDV